MISVEQFFGVSLWKVIAVEYVFCAMLVAIALVAKAPPGKIDVKRWLLNSIFWPLLILGRLL